MESFPEMGRFFFEKKSKKELKTNTSIGARHFYNSSNSSIKLREFDKRGTLCCPPNFPFLVNQS